MNVLVQSKNNLARLLATENIKIRHQDVPTAYFNTVTRELTFPIWKDMDSTLYTLLAGHEVGHALWTDKSELKELAKQIDPDNIELAASYLNIVEDARIERLIKNRYPGLRTQFVDGYKDLFDRDFFSTNTKNANDRCFIDKANLHFKIGHHLSLEFEEKQNYYIDKIATTITFQDVMTVTKEVYEYSKNEENQPTPTQFEYVLGEDGEGEPIELSQEEYEKLAKCPITQKAFDEQLKKLQAKTKDNPIYISLPTIHLENIIEDYKSVLERLIVTKTTDAEIKFNAFKKENESKVNYLFQQFELKKQADRYKRVKSHKTGSLDVLRLHAYKYEEELFKTIQSVSDGKNHALIFIVDWSSSMSGCIADTIKQLIVLCLFCKKARIPYDVYSLTVGTEGKQAFTHEPNQLCYDKKFRMRNYLSSRMTSEQFYQACIGLFKLMNSNFSQSGKDGLVGSTPLDEAVITSMELIDIMRKRTNAQIVNAVFLTDGGANGVSQFLDHKGLVGNMYEHQFILEDHKTFHQYLLVPGEMTPTLLQLVRDRKNVNVVGFFIGTYYESFFKKANKSELKRSWDENGFVISTEWGYNELYILRSERLKIKDTEKLMGSNIEDIAKKFTANLSSMSKQRVILDKFIKQIA